MVTFTEKILNGKLHFLCRAGCFQKKQLIISVNMSPSRIFLQIHMIESRRQFFNSYFSTFSWPGTNLPFLPYRWKNSIFKALLRRIENFPQMSRSMVLPETFNTQMLTYLGHYVSQYVNIKDNIDTK